MTARAANKRGWPWQPTFNHPHLMLRCPRSPAECARTHVRKKDENLRGNRDEIYNPFPLPCCTPLILLASQNEQNGVYTIDSFSDTEFPFARLETFDRAEREISGNDGRRCWLPIDVPHCAHSNRHQHV